MGVPAPIITHSAPFDHGPSHRHFVVAAGEKHGVVRPLLDQCLFCHLLYKHGHINLPSLSKILPSVRCLLSIYSFYSNLLIALRGKI